MSRPGPLARYRAATESAGFEFDPQQYAAAETLQAIRDELVARPPRSWLGGRLHWPPVKGLYLWGGVGRGKTFLMDCFHESLPFSRKRRTHFHRFMLEVHARRNAHAHRSDPLHIVGKEIADESRVLCFDEFFVSDIADAMILGRLTEVLFERGVTLVATSNVPPDRLYQDGLQRERFLPAIARIKAHTRVMHLDIDTDYRLRTLTRAEIFHTPCDAHSESLLEQCFDAIAPEAGRREVTLEINGRPLHCRRLADGVAWFDFQTLCVEPRAASDYIELAREFQTVLLWKVPVMGADADDAARRFITLVDEFYDRNVKLIIAADAGIDALYTGRRLAFEFRRTRSRLIEMQSHEYLGRAHLP